MAEHHVGVVKRLLHLHGTVGAAANVVVCADNKNIVSITAVEFNTAESVGKENVSTRISFFSFLDADSKMLNYIEFRISF